MPEIRIWFILLIISEFKWWCILVEVCFYKTSLTCKCFFFHFDDLFHWRAERRKTSKGSISHHKKLKEARLKVDTLTSEEVWTIPRHRCQRVQCVRKCLYRAVEGQNVHEKSYHFVILSTSKAFKCFGPRRDEIRCAFDPP